MVQRVGVLSLRGVSSGKLGHGIATISLWEKQDEERPMIFGMTTFTEVHVALSLIGIFAGFVVAFGLLTAKRLDLWTAFFLISTVATSVTGFFFPFHGFTPAIGVGIVSLVVLAGSCFLRVTPQPEGAARLV